MSECHLLGTHGGCDNAWQHRNEFEKFLTVPATWVANESPGLWSLGFGYLNFDCISGSSWVFQAQSQPRTIVLQTPTVWRVRSRYVGPLLCFSHLGKARASNLSVSIWCRQQKAEIERKKYISKIARDRRYEMSRELDFNISSSVGKNTIAM